MQDLSWTEASHALLDEFDILGQIVAGTDLAAQLDLGLCKLQLDAERDGNQAHPVESTLRLVRVMS